MRRIADYEMLEKIASATNGEVCIFGAGQIGTGYGYDLLKIAGLSVDFFVDNQKNDDQVVIDNIRIKPLKYLYDHKDTIQVFICVRHYLTIEIEKQLIDKGVENFWICDSVAMALVMESVDKASVEIRKKYGKIYDNRRFLLDRYKSVTGKELNLDNPRMYNEKLQWLKIYDYHPEYSKYVDKLAFKEYITDKYGVDYSIKMLGAWDHYDEIDFDKLPTKFVLKCTHDSGSIAIVKDKYAIDHEVNRRLFEEKLMMNYYWMGREWPYRNAQRKIIAEEYVEDDFGELRDYKLFCFDGKVKLIQVDFDRFRGHRRNVYDTDWNYIPVTIKYPTDSDYIIREPSCLDSMIEIAEELSAGIIHVRVDFYIIDNHPLIGEMTFFHGGGMETFTPNTWNYKLGEYIRLPQI